jgi:hypothetical protein
MAIRMLQQQQSSKAVLSALIKFKGVSRRQAYRYLRQAQSNLVLRPVPQTKAVFTVNLPRPLIQQVRARCRQQHRPISHLVAEALQEWLEQPPAHGPK